MRTLNRLNIVTIIVASLLPALNSWAVTQTAKLQGTFGDHPLDTVNANDASSTPQVGYLKGMAYQNTLTISHAMDGLGDGISTYVAVDSMSTDNSKIMLNQHSGKTYSLSQLNETADSRHVEGSVTKSLKNYEFKWDGRSSVGHDLYYTTQLMASITGIYLAEGARIGLQFNRSDSDQPLTAFIDRDFKTKYRPTKIVSQTTAVNWEQVIGERNKVRVELFTTEPTAERPRAIGERVKTATALNNSFFTKTALNHVQEQRNENLKNERGYFDLTSGSLGLAWEATYDVILECEGTYMKENEVDPRVKEKKSLESRSLGLGAAIKRFNPGIELGGLYTQLTSTNESFYSLQGAIIWSF